MKNHAESAHKPAGAPSRPGHGGAPGDGLHGASDDDQSRMGNAAVASGLSSDSAAGPFTDQLNAVLQQAFGPQVAGLDVDTNATAQAQGIGAEAFTTGDHISLSAGVTQDLGDRRSMEIIGHEVAHALAGGGSGDTLLDQPGDAGEAQADATGKRFADYVSGGMQGAPPKLSAAGGGHAAVHRWSFDGPFGVNDPGHEILTMMSLREASADVGAAKAADSLLGGVWSNELPSPDQHAGRQFDALKLNGDHTPDAEQEFVRGSIFNDDPRGYLYLSDTGTQHQSAGLRWLADFSPDKADDKDSLTSRSHYGDMQFLHSMASEDKEAAGLTKQKMLDWAVLTSGVAKGEIASDTLLVDVPQVAALFADAQADWTVKDLFGGSKGKHASFSDAMLRQRAAGSLLHMIQDSYAAGHTERNDEGQVVQLQDYRAQDPKKHATGDKLAEGDTFAERLDNTRFGNKIVDQGAAVLELIQAGASTAEILKLLDEEVFPLAPDVKAGGSSDRFKKDEPVPMFGLGSVAQGNS